VPIAQKRAQSAQAHAVRRQAPEAARHMRLAHGDLRKKSLFVTFSPLKAHVFSPS